MMCHFSCGSGKYRRGMCLILAVLSIIILFTACSRPREAPSEDSSESRPSGSTSSHKAASAPPRQPPGAVYGYGVRLDWPYTFTESEDGKTLYLNGLVYDGPGVRPPPEITVTETVRSEHELSVRAYEACRLAETHSERKAIYARILRESDLVVDVREFSQGVYVTWRSSPEDEEEVIIPREDSQFDLEEFRRRLVSEFWDTVNSGGMIAFGERYHIRVPPGRVSKTVEQINLVRSGASRDQLGASDAALQNEHFLDDLYEKARNRTEQN
jgi:hypothetical protein